GHGFLEAADGGADVFVHVSAVHGTGMKPLSRGEPVEYDKVDTDLGPAAEGIVRIR
ncbi:MAG TPA: cold shock domain-containing protein, partial [Longimicrobium sp.]|nr:cold shock domain-containing protein [Longimicrobium sp.]